jgi:hypothetical protein
MSSDPPTGSGGVVHRRRRLIKNNTFETPPRRGIAGGEGGTMIELAILSIGIVLGLCGAGILDSIRRAAANRAYLRYGGK